MMEIWPIIKTRRTIIEAQECFTYHPQAVAQLMNPRKLSSHWKETYLKPCQTSMSKRFYDKKIHYECPTGSYPAGIFLFKVYNRNTRTKCEICSQLKIKTPERRQNNFIVNFEHTSHLALVFLSLTLNI